MIIIALFITALPDDAELRRQQEAAAAMAFHAAMRAKAAERPAAPPRAKSQTRRYTVAVEGAGTGVYSQTISENPDGTVAVQASSNLDVKKFGFRYHYDFSGSETWKGCDCLRSVARKNDNGSVSDFAKAAACDWTTSFWKLPDKTGNLVVFDLDTGRYEQCVLTKLGQDGRGTHYRLSGGIQSDLWFDAEGRLTQRSFTRKGRPATVSLNGVS